MLIRLNAVTIPELRLLLKDGYRRMSPAKSAVALSVTSPAFAERGDIPFGNTQYKGHTFPRFSWRAGPKYRYHK